MGKLSERYSAVVKYEINNKCEIKNECKELCNSFTRSKRSFSPILINNKPIESVSNAKVLGVSVPENLKWNVHVLESVKKALSRLNFLRQLKQAKIIEKDCQSSISHVRGCLPSMSVQSFTIFCHYI